MGLGESLVLFGGTMKTIDAIIVLENAGYRVKFEKGAWLVSLWKGCTERLNRLELVKLAQDLIYIGR